MTHKPPVPMLRIPSSHGGWVVVLVLGVRKKTKMLGLKSDWEAGKWRQ